MHKPSVADIKTAIDRSGYVLELRLAPKVERVGFWTDGDRQFRDQDTGKSREIDLYARCQTDIAKEERRVGKITYVLSDSFHMHLVFECKSISTPIVFFSRKNTLPIHGNLLFGGLPHYVWKRDKPSNEVVGELFDYHLRFAHFHSYWTPDYLATRFGRSSSKKVAGGSIEWELDHGTIYSSIEKLCKAALSIHREQLRNARRIDPEDPHTDQFQLHMTYPVLVMAGDIYECRVTERGYALRKAKAIHLDWSLDSEKVNGSARICVVTEKWFGSFLKLIVADRLGTEKALRRKTSILKRAIAFEKADPKLLEHFPEDV